MNFLYSEIKTNIKTAFLLNLLKCSNSTKIRQVWIEKDIFNYGPEKL